MFVRLLWYVCQHFTGCFTGGTAAAIVFPAFAALVILAVLNMWAVYAMPFALVGCQHGFSQCSGHIIPPVFCVLFVNLVRAPCNFVACFRVMLQVNNLVWRLFCHVRAFRRLTGSINSDWLTVC